MEFQTLCENKTVSSTAEIPIVKNFISEPTESFICVILRSRGEDGIVVKDPNTITIIIEDDDCEYSNCFQNPCTHSIFRSGYLCWGLLTTSIFN